MEHSQPGRSRSEDSLEVVVSPQPTPRVAARPSLPVLPRSTPGVRAVRRMTEKLPAPTPPIPLTQKKNAELLGAGEAHHVAAMFQEPSPDAPVPFGNYELMRRIGAGGMGEVFLARE